MDRNELNLKMEELKTAMHNRDFEKAVEIADSLELKKIKDNNFLSLAADAYEVTHRYSQAKKVLLLAYENTDAGRHLAYRLCLIAIKTKEYDEAREYYEDFVELAPRDTGRYILRYKMAKAQGQPIDKLIRILEEYVNIDMEEKWAYELAKLYHMAGDEEKCVDMCDEISLWFSDGKYVTKAMELKKMHRALTPAQQLILDKMENDVQDVEEIKIAPAEEGTDAMELQSVVAEGMKEVQLHETANFHEDVGATKAAPDFSKVQTEDGMEELKSAEPEEIIKTGAQAEESGRKETENIEDKQETVKDWETVEERQETAKDTKETEDIKENEPEKISSIQEVEDILRQLQKRGILKEETVRQAVDIIDEAGKEEKTAPQNESTSERWAQDNRPVEKEIPEVSEPELQKEKNEEAEPAKSQPEKRADTAEIKLPEETKQAENISNTKKIPVPEIVDEIEEIVEEIGKASQNIPKPAEDMAEGVPVLDLSFETPQRDTRNDIGNNNMYKNMVVNSDLGSATDKLPSQEEIDEAVKKAEQAMEKSSGENLSEIQEDETKKRGQETELHTNKNLSAKIEIISGTDWEQPEETQDVERKPDTKAVSSVTPEKEETQPFGSTSADAEKLSDREAPESTENQPEKTAAPENKENQPAKKAGQESAENQQAKKAGQESTENQPEKTAAPGKEKETPVEVISVETELSLTEEDLAVFRNYLNVEGFESNLREILGKLVTEFKPDGKSEDSNVIIMGEGKSGKTTLAIELIKLVNRKRGRRNRRLAKIDAGALNRRGFRNSLNKLLGSDLIIENAQNLGVMTLSEIIDVSGMFTDDMLIILEGKTEGMEKLLKDSPRMADVFSHVIRIKEYDIGEWVSYGTGYAKSQGYSIDELANLAFYRAVDDFFGKNNGIGKADVEYIVDQAIENSGKLGRKITGIFSSRKDENGLYILVESDFNI